MIENTHERNTLLFLRKINLRVLEICLKGYKRTEDEMYWENAVICAGNSERWKRELELLK